MVIVPVREQFRELDWKNISARPENILAIQNYMESMNKDPEKKNNRTVPIGICDSIKDKIGISRIELFLDGDGRIYIQENNQNKNNLIEFSNIDEVRRIF